MISFQQLKTFKEIMNFERLLNEVVYLNWTEFQLLEMWMNFILFIDYVEFLKGNEETQKKRIKRKISRWSRLNKNVCHDTILNSWHLFDTYCFHSIFQEKQNNEKNSVTIDFIDEEKIDWERMM